MNDEMRRHLDALLDARANRRSAIGSIGAAGAVGAVAGSLTGRGAAAQQEAATPVATRDAALLNPIDAYLDRPVADLVRLPPPDLSEEMIERHRIFSLLLLATTAYFFNGNKRGSTGEYPWREKQRLPNGTYIGGQYFGHNIASVAVDGFGQMIDFDFNHNELFQSSVEHAESRLIRRIFSVSEVASNWELRSPDDESQDSGYGTVLSNVTIYTSLESCSQCSGIMTLGRVKEVVFLQSDPTQYNIGAILYNVTSNTESSAPRPIPAREIGFEYAKELDDRYLEFVQGVKSVPFYRGDWEDSIPSITSFLCTDLALEVYENAASEFMTMTLAHPNFAPDSAPPTARGSAASVRLEAPLTNAEALAQAQLFFDFVVKPGRRGTPHRA